MNHPITTRLKQQGYLVLDGAMGTELERLGEDLNDPLWSGRILRDAPERIAEVHASHLKAGADVILSASYQIAQDTELLARSIEVARVACSQHQPEAFVAASLGPYGAFLANGSEYSGDYGVSNQTLTAFHADKLRALIKSNPDVLVFETIPSLQEAQAIAAAIKHAKPKIPVWVSFSCHDSQHVCSGEALKDCVQAVASLPIVTSIGINCTPPSYIQSLLGIAATVTSKTLLAYPNRGATWNSATQEWRGAETVCIADWVDEYVEAGARIIGGCCQTTPTDIGKVATQLYNLLGSS